MVVARPRSSCLSGASAFVRVLVSPPAAVGETLADALHVRAENFLFRWAQRGEDIAVGFFQSCSHLAQRRIAEPREVECIGPGIGRCRACYEPTSLEDIDQFHGTGAIDRQRLAQRSLGAAGILVDHDHRRDPGWRNVEFRECFACARIDIDLEHLELITEGIVEVSLVGPAIVFNLQ